MRNWQQEESLEIKEKKSKNLLWLAMVSIFMVFAGFTSAYLVLMYNSFWISFALPFQFFISSIIVVLSSLFIWLCLKAAKVGNQKMVKLYVVITLLTSLGFAGSQFIGWKKLMSEGNYFVGPISAYGKYGQTFDIYYKDKLILFDGINYLYDGRKISSELKGKMDAFLKQIAKVDPKKRRYDLDEFDDFKILYKPDNVKHERFLVYEDHQLHSISPTGRTHAITVVQSRELQRLAENILQDKGDFFLSGTYGKDYWISYKGEKLTYENRKLYFQGNELKEGDLMDLEASRNFRSTFIYILSVFHLLHLIGGLFYLSYVVVNIFKNKIGVANPLKIKLVGIYWHFLGFLWLFLYSFLTFIA